MEPMTHTYSVPWIISILLALYGLGVTSEPAYNKWESGKGLAYNATNSLDSTVIGVLKSHNESGATARLPEVSNRMDVKGVITPRTREAAVASASAKPWGSNRDVSQNSTEPWMQEITTGPINHFLTYAQAIKHLDEWVFQYPHVVSKFIAGLSFEGRPIWAYRLKQKSNDSIMRDETHNGPTARARFFFGNEPRIFDTLPIPRCLAPSADKRQDLATLLKLQAQPGPPKVTSKWKRKPAVLLTAMHHAREPLSFVTLLYFVGRFIKEAMGEWGVRSNGTSVFGPHNTADKAYLLARYLLRERDIVVVPFVNPDGYVAIEREGVLTIRKNRRPTCSKKDLVEAQGVDLNRNYAFGFKQDHHGCDLQEYEGQAPFSEPETRAIRCLTDAFDFKAALNFHTYGNYWTRPVNCRRGMQLPRLVADIYEQVRNELNLAVLDSAPNIPDLNYETSGEADDWMLYARGIIAMSPELGSDSGEFWPDIGETRKTIEETYPRIVKIVYKSGFSLYATIHIKNDDDGTPVVAVLLENRGLAPVSHAFKLAGMMSVAETVLPAAIMPTKGIGSFQELFAADFLNMQQSLETSYTLSPSFNGQHVLGDTLNLCAILSEESDICFCGHAPVTQRNVTFPLELTLSHSSPVCQRSRAAFASSITHSVAVPLHYRPGRIAASGVIAISLEVVFVIVFSIAFCFIESFDKNSMDANDTSLLRRISVACATRISFLLCCIPSCQRLHRRLRLMRQVKRIPLHSRRESPDHEGPAPLIFCDDPENIVPQSQGSLSSGMTPEDRVAVSYVTKDKSPYSYGSDSTRPITP